MLVPRNPVSNTPYEQNRRVSLQHRSSFKDFFKPSTITALARIFSLLIETEVYYDSLRRELHKPGQLSHSDIFSLLDKNGDGIIDRFELRTFLKSKGLDPTANELDNVLTKMSYINGRSLRYSEIAREITPAHLS
eukprot:TRINITY_DN753_c0_g1_i3.p1 TRINITY_DN753_c0_g1~~TRINITY_DN753_c0_g1_i3.p1  ORF type:complete len:135 (+),score=21.70 TRINITY_DN753_c0_g1_i3:165-569(+)